MIKTWKFCIIVVLLIATLAISPVVSQAATERGKVNISSFEPTSAARLSQFTMDIKGSGFSNTTGVILTHKGCKAILAKNFTKSDDEIYADFIIPNETGKWNKEQQESRNANWCLVVTVNNTGSHPYGMSCGFNIT